MDGEITKKIHSLKLLPTWTSQMLFVDIFDGQIKQRCKASTMPRVVFTVSGTGTLTTGDGIIKKGYSLQIFLLHLRSTCSWLKHVHNWVIQQDNKHISIMIL
ncbi:hypothetical protein GOODEAATRI_006999 [Goodea atripinnis]|uniref:Uncharacterized protein n=1 Tax=Goodea atripinnis TaxID=208336 RepID=A0ABV0NSD7_9TELE